MIEKWGKHNKTTI